MTRKQMNRNPRGYFGIGVYHPKTEQNIGTLMRSAYLYGAAFVFTVGRRYKVQASDTPKTFRKIPLMHYTDIDDLIEHLPFSSPLVGVELDPTAVPLSQYTHRPQATYLLGAEDHGLPPEVIAKCHELVVLESVQPYSMNVATAGSIIMYDRHTRASAAKAVAV